jgi:uncharacterized protein (TIGR02996 family)
MTEQDAFLRAIRDAPEDDAPRLVYADWLEELGDTDRAEFIRVQCELARPGVAPARRRLAARAKKLLAAHRVRWLARLARSPLPWMFHRGFVERLGSGGFFRHGPEVYRDETWWEHVRFFPDGRVLHEMTECPRSRYRLRDVARRLRRGHRRLDGAYTLTAGPGRVEVRFSIPGRPADEVPPVDYKGTIRGTTLSLRGKATWPASCPFREEYEWVAMPDGR